MSDPQNLNQTSPGALSTGAPPKTELPLTPTPETPSTAAGAPAPPSTSDGTAVPPPTTTANSEGGTPVALGRAGSGAPAQPAGAGLQQGGNTIVVSSSGAGVGPTTGLIANGAISQNALIKASTVAGRYETLGATDSPLKMVGVAAAAAAGAGSTFSAQLIPGTATTMLNDGTGVINAGDTVTPSTTVAGRVKAGTSNVVGSALSGAGAVLNAQVTVL